MRINTFLSSVLLVNAWIVLLAGPLRAEPPAGDPLVERVGPFFAAYCVDCHSGADAESGVDLDQSVSLRRAQKNPARWRQIRGLIELHAMPPADHDAQPTSDERLAAARAIDELLNQVDCGGEPDPGRVTMRRLNTAEYDNTVQALLGVDFLPSDFVGLPEDNIGNGFDNQGEVLSFSPLLLEKYLDAAEEITERAIVFDRESLRTQKRSGVRLFIGESAERTFWAGPGRYEIECSMNFGWGEVEGEAVAEVLLDGRPVGEATVKREREPHTFTFEVDEARDYRVELRFARDSGLKADGETDYQPRHRWLDIKTIVVTGPEEGAPAYPLSHRRLITHTPDDHTTVREAARRNFDRLLPKAFRRPVTPNEVEQHVDLVVATVEQGGSFERGMARGVQAVLVSPHFLFRVETSGSGPAGEGPTPLDNFELANRLSFFLWASMPDDQLLDQARAHTLRQPSELRQAVERLLADEQAAALVERFFGQWLGLDALDQVAPDSEQHPMWGTQLREAMREETLQLVRYVMREDLSLFELFDADYTFVNPRMADFYGIGFRTRDPYQLYLEGPGQPHGREERRDRSGKYLYENQWVRVPTPAGRRGVLTHAGVLTLTSHPRETSPVKRGQWVLDTILGEPPPPAPPSVPALEELPADLREKPLREQLARHREDPSCATCHQQMDPIGLAMENFGPIGAWRDQDDYGHAVDASGELNGQPFGGPIDLIAIVRAEEEKIARHFAGRMLTYAIGRGLEPNDRCAVDQIVDQSKAEGYRISSFITGVVMSKPFRMKGRASGASGTSGGVGDGE